MDLGKVDIETEKASAGATTGRKAWFPEAPKAEGVVHSLAPKVEVRFSSILNPGLVH